MNNHLEQTPGGLNHTIYPWNRDVFASLLQRFQRRQLAHGILISGRDGLGKRAMATQLSASLLCLNPTGDGEACGHCKSCHLIAADAHPDFLRIATEKTSSGILIDQIRQLNQFAALKSQLGGVQVVLIEDAQRMNRNAANALLKTLEEPNDNLYLLLLSDTVQGLLPTIRSRCQHYRSGEPDDQQQMQWLRDKLPRASESELRQALAMAYGAPPLAADLLANEVPATHLQQLKLFLSLAQGRLSAVEVAAVYNNGDTETSLMWLYTWLVDLVRLKSGLSLADRYNDELLAQLSQVSQNLDIEQLFDYYGHLVEALRIRHTQVNQQLLTEQLLILWRRLCAQNPQQNQTGAIA